MNMRLLDFLFRLTEVLLIGLCVGLERQWRQRMAGARTTALGAAGAAGLILSGLPALPATSPPCSAIAAAHAKGEFRVAWVGTSVTGGLGIDVPADRIDSKVNVFLQGQSGTRVTSRNFAFGAAPSLVQVAVLKYLAIPWHPDLIIAELGTMDKFNLELSLPAIEGFLRIARQAGVPVIAWYANTGYDEPAIRVGLRRLGLAYGHQVVDLKTLSAAHGLTLAAVTVDGAHPNKLGVAEIVAAIEASASAECGWTALPERVIYKPDFTGIRFDSPNSNCEPVGSAYPLSTGGPLCALVETQTEFSFNGRLIVAVFDADRAPGMLRYSVDGAAWTDVKVQPDWFLFYVLRSDLRSGKHAIKVRIAPRGNKWATLEGFLSVPN